MDPRLNSCRDSCGQILQDEDNSRRIIGEAEPCPEKNGDHIFPVLEVETFPTVHGQKSSLGVKKGVMSTSWILS